MSTYAENDASSFHSQHSPPLLEQKRHFDALLNASHDPLFLLDFYGRFTYVNRAAKDLMQGFFFVLAQPPPETLLGKTARELSFPADVLTSFEEYIVQALSGETVIGEMVLPSPSGRRRCECVLSPLPENDGHIQAIAGRIRDMHEHTEGEGSAHLEQERLYSLFMQAPVAIAIFRGPTHVIELANPLVCEIWGRTQVAILGKPLFEALPEASGQGFEELLQNVLVTGKSYYGNELPATLHRYGKKETVYFNFVYEPLRDQVGGITGVIVVATDGSEQVVARQKTEQLAAQVEQQARTFDTALTAIQDFVYTFDTSGRFTYANQPLLDLLGLPLDSIRGKDFHDLPYPPELATLLQTHIAHVVAHQTPLTAETPYTNPAGTLGYYEYIFVPVFGKNKAVVAVAGSTRDITYRKHLERQKDEFMGIVSHELKTPVTSLKAFGQILQNRLRKEGHIRAAEHLGKMDIQINKLASLIGNLLDITKIEGGQFHFQEDFFSFDELVDEIVEEVQWTTEKHHIVREGFLAKSIHGDRERLGQVVTNLLTNAIKYSPHSETIRVTVSAEKEGVTVCVQDDGIGIAQEKQPYVFDRFFRVNEEQQETYPGIGLGLSIVKEILTRQGGRVWVESEKGKGSTFCFHVPIAKRTEETNQTQLARRE